jgi:hypothetical protein
MVNPLVKVGEAGDDNARCVLESPGKKEQGGLIRERGFHRECE